MKSEATLWDERRREKLRLRAEMHARGMDFREPVYPPFDPTPADPSQSVEIPYISYPSRRR